MNKSFDINAESFAYWLQGFVELNGSVPTPEQWKSIKDHLRLVFKRVTPQYAPNIKLGPNIARPALPMDEGKYQFPDLPTEVRTKYSLPGYVNTYSFTSPSKAAEDMYEANRGH